MYWKLDFSPVTRDMMAVLSLVVVGFVKMFKSKDFEISYCVYDKRVVLS
jgi:hypothetical protein